MCPETTHCIDIWLFLKSSTKQRETWLRSWNKEIRELKNNNNKDTFKCCSKACRHGYHKPLVAVKTATETVAVKFMKSDWTPVAELFQGNHNGLLSISSHSRSLMKWTGTTFNWAIYGYFLSHLSSHVTRCDRLVWSILYFLMETEEQRGEQVIYPRACGW